jgi:hypothetical protein
MTRAFLCAAALLLAGGCERSGPDTAPAKDAASAAAAPAAPPARAAAAPAQADARVLRTETVEAVFTGWEQGDYLWARLEVKGREPFGAWSGPSPIDLFLDHHVGKPLTVRLETVDAEVPEAGGRMELQRVADARIGALTAANWWAGLSPKQRQDAQIGLAGSLEPRPPQSEMDDMKEP